MLSNIGPWNEFEIVAPKGVKKREKFHPDVNGRPIYFGPDGLPRLAVKAAEHVTAQGHHDQQEETKEGHIVHGAGDDDEFHDAVGE